MHPRSGGTECQEIQLGEPEQPSLLCLPPPFRPYISISTILEKEERKEKQSPPRYGQTRGKGDFYKCLELLNLSGPTAHRAVMEERGK